LPTDPQTVTVENRFTGAQKQVGDLSSASPAKSLVPAAAFPKSSSDELRHDNRFITLAADLSESINVEHGSLWAL